MKSSAKQSKAAAGSRRKVSSEQLLQYGSIVFGVGLLIVLVASFLSLGDNSVKIVVGTLTILGVVIGLLNVTNKEAVGFMIATVIIVMLLQPFLGLISQYFGMQAFLIRLITYLTALLVPAAIVVAARTLFVTAKDE